MNALHELRSLGLVTLAASRRYVHFRYGRLRIRRRQDVVTVVAVGTNRGARVSMRYRFRMNTLAIGKKRTVADATALHHRFVAVTATASVGDVLPVNSRVGIRGGQDRRQVAVARVTIHARSGLAATLNRLRMKTVIVGSMYFRVKPGAAEIRQSLARRVTTLALKVWGNNLSGRRTRRRAGRSCWFRR